MSAVCLYIMQVLMQIKQTDASWCENMAWNIVQWKKKNSQSNNHSTVPFMFLRS